MQTRYIYDNEVNPLLLQLISLSRFCLVHGPINFVFNTLNNPRDLISAIYFLNYHIKFYTSLFLQVSVVKVEELLFCTYLIFVSQVPVVNVEGLEFPFFQLNFTGGTPCDLTGTPRRAFLKYVCHEEGRGDIYEIKELATCEYQVIVLTSTLCSHPSYR